LHDNIRDSSDGPRSRQARCLTNSSTDELTEEVQLVAAFSDFVEAGVRLAVLLTLE
jgi:hypothetical protein